MNKNGLGVRKLVTLTATMALLVGLGSRAHAGFQGTIEFTEQEKVAHLSALPVILKEAASCLQQDIEHHQSFYERLGISPFYGDRSAFAKMTPVQKRAHLESLGQDPRILSELQPTSCIGLTLKCLGRGFQVGGQQDVWKRLRQYTIDNGVDGTALQNGLQKMGWKILYWNPDVSQNTKWDEMEKAKHVGNRDRFWGFHEENWRAVTRRNRYYYNTVDDKKTLVNFGAQVPSAIRKVPFFIGTAHMGYHVFPGTFGNIIEAHSTRRLTDAKTLQSAPFNPIGGGGPTDGEYRSGLILVPPGAI